MSKAISRAIQSSAFQLETVMAGFPQAHLDQRVVPTAMTPRETLKHLLHCYEAFDSLAGGVPFDWGKEFDRNVEDEGEAVRAVVASRAKVREALEGASSEEIATLALEYIVAHDSYHIGQLALQRMAVDPAWDPYSLYREPGH